MTNLKAHFFIPEQYWSSNYELVKEMLPQAEVYVYENDKKVQGFVDVRDEYVEGIFVVDEMQSQGIGFFEPFYFLSYQCRNNKTLFRVQFVSYLCYTVHLLLLQEDFPNTEYYSSKLRNDDEIAAALFRLHGADSWAWYHMSKRLKKKYKIEEM